MRACPFFILINVKTLKGKPLVFLYLKRPQVAVASRQNLLRISRCEAGRKTAETTRRKFCTELFCEAETTLVLNLSGFELFCCLRETQTFPGVVLRSGNNSGEKSFRTKLFALATVVGCPNADFSLSYSAPAEITQEKSRLELSC